MTTATVHHIQPRVERWAERIREAHGQNVAAILKVGHELLQAKAECSHGEWGELTGRDNGQPLLPFSFQTAHRYMQIAKHPALSNVAHGRHFPAAWRTLAILARLTDDQIEAALADGHIHPELQRKDAETLVQRLLAEDQAAAALPQPSLGLTPSQQTPQPPATTNPAPAASAAPMTDEERAFIASAPARIGQMIQDHIDRSAENDRAAAELAAQFPVSPQTASAKQTAEQVLEQLQALANLLDQADPKPRFERHWKQAIDLATRITQHLETCQ